MPVVPYRGKGVKSDYLDAQITVQRGRYGVLLQNGTTSSHARRIYLEYKGKIRPGCHIHHIDGNEINDHPDNLLEIPFKWNSDYFPSLSEALAVHEAEITRIYIQLVREVDERELYRAVLRKAIKLEAR